MRAPRGVRPCPSARALASAFTEGTSAADKGRLLDHVASCPDCAREFRALTELWRHRDEVPAGLRPIPDLKGLARHRIAEIRARGRGRGLLSRLPAPRVLSLAGGAALVFLCVVGYSLWKDGRSADADRVAVTGGIALLSPRGGETLAPSFAFRWSAVEDATGYTLEILDSALLPVLSYAHLSETRCEPPAEDLRDLVKGRTYFWKVIADLGDLRRVESRIARFKVPD